MNETHTTKNYFAHGGNELVVGGKLTFLPGASVEGAEGLFDLPPQGEVPQIPDCEASTVAQMRDYINGALNTLREAGVIAAPDHPDTPAQETGEAE